MSLNYGAPRSTGLLGSVRRFADNLLGLFETRLDILSTDVAEARYDLVRLAAVLVGVLFCFQAGVLLAVLFFVLSAAAADRLAAVGIAAAVLLAMAVIGALWLVRWLQTRRRLFESTIAELKKDRERLGGRG